jgi:hypothetical protein
MWRRRLKRRVGWDDTNLTAVKEILAGQKPSFWQHYDRDWKSYNARLVEGYKREDLGELVASVEASHQELIVFLQGVPAGEYAKRAGIARLLQTEIDDEKVHHRQIEGFVERRAAW